MSPTSKDPVFYVDPRRMANCKKIKNTLEAHVLGNDTYRVKISVQGERSGRAYCSCPAFSNQGNCKHIIAVLMAYKKHPVWFENVLNMTGKLENLPKEKLINMLETLLTSVPQARDIIESEMVDSGHRGEMYSRKIKEAFRACSIINGSPEHLYQELDSFFERASRLFEDKEYIPCLHICYGIVEGCLTLDDDWGSTEIFPEGFVGEVWEIYLKALRKAALSGVEKNTVKKQIDVLSRFESYLFDQEGVYPEEAVEILKKGYGTKRSARS